MVQVWEFWCQNLSNGFGWSVYLAEQMSFKEIATIYRNEAWEGPNQERDLLQLANLILEEGDREISFFDLKDHGTSVEGTINEKATWSLRLIKAHRRKP